MGKRALARVEEEIKRKLAEIIEFEARDPRFEGATVMGVKLSLDMRQATVFINVIDDEHREAETIAAFQRHQGFFRSELAKRFKHRYIPALDFQIDEVTKRAMRIEKLLKEEQQER